MTTMKRYLLFIIGVSMCQMIYSQNFSEKQKSVIYNEAIKNLQAYQGYINQIADEAVDIAKVNKTGEKLIELFVNRKTLIYNDLDPSHQLSEFYELETYVSNFLLWYPDGMKVFLDFENLKAGNIISHENDIFTLDILTTKKITGNYLNKQNNTNTEELLFRIAFYQKGNSFENFKIAGIRTPTSKRQQDDSNTIAEVKNAGFDPKEMQKVKDQSKSVLNDYVNYLSLLADPKEEADDKTFYKTSFLNLFKHEKSNLANDIEPEPQKRWLTVVDYLQLYVQSYLEGIRNMGVNIDSVAFSAVIPVGKDKFYIHVYADKFFSGKFQNKTMFRDNARLDFKIIFERDENTYKNFKIESIDKYGINYYSQSTNTTQIEIPQQKVTSLQRRGFYFGLSASYDLLKYSDPNLTGDDSLKWNITNKYGLKAGISIKYYPLNLLGIETGVLYNRYKANAQLNGNFRNNVYLVDPNEEQYLKILNASYDSLISLNYISVPLNLVFHSNKKSEKTGMFVKTGVLMSILLNSKYKATGNIQTSGYYEQYPTSMQYLSNPELGFENRSNINSSDALDVKPVIFSLITAFGVTIPVNYYTSVELGPEIIWGTANIVNHSEFVNAFGVKTSTKKVNIVKYGFKFGINYKF